MQKNILHIQNKRTRRLVRNFNRPSAFSMNPALVNHSKSGLRVQLYKTKSYIQSSLNGKSIQSKFYFLPKQCAMFFKKFRALYKVMENFFKILAASKVYTYTVILIQLSILALLGLQLYFAVSISWDGFSIVNWILLTKICLLYGVSITYVVEALLRSLNSLVMTYPDNKNKLTSLNLLKISLVLLALFFVPFYLKWDILLSILLVCIMVISIEIVVIIFEEWYLTGSNDFSILGLHMNQYLSLLDHAIGCSEYNNPFTALLVIIALSAIILDLLLNRLNLKILPS